jgi:hypothetical protein
MTYNTCHALIRILINCLIELTTQHICYAKMDTKMNKLIEIYTTEFKDQIRNKAIHLDFVEKEKINELVEFVYEYSRLVLTKDDFVKRKRVKNAIPFAHRCVAKRADGDQCTRRRKSGSDCCGTHVKNMPHGIICEDTIPPAKNEKIEVIAEDIKGIVYYIDKSNNVYKTEDILSGKENPQIIAKCVLQDGKYTIPEFGLV